MHASGQTEKEKLGSRQETTPNNSKGKLSLVTSLSALSMVVYYSAWLTAASESYEFEACFYYSLQETLEIAASKCISFANYDYSVSLADLTRF